MSLTLRGSYWHVVGFCGQLDEELLMKHHLGGSKLIIISVYLTPPQRVHFQGYGPPVDFFPPVQALPP